MKKRLFVAVGVLVATLTVSAVWAADHIDGPAASADPSADLTDVFAWMSSDAQKVYLVMDLVRNAMVGMSRFSDSVQYVFHTTSRQSFGGAAAPEVDVICTFNTAQTVQCWAGSAAYVTGNASSTNGITSTDGKLRVFAGLRNDPFFFNLAGFREASRTVKAASGLIPDAAGCPGVDAATSQVLVTKLQTAPDGSPAVDGFANFNVLALVVVADKSILTKGGPIVGVSASTRRK